MPEVTMCGMIQSMDELYVSAKEQPSPAQNEDREFTAGSHFVGSPLLFGFGTVERADTAPLTLGESQGIRLCSRCAADRTLRSESGASGICVGGVGAGTSFVQVPDVTEGRSTMKNDHRSFFDLRVERGPEVVA